MKIRHISKVDLLRDIYREEQLELLDSVLCGQGVPRDERQMRLHRVRDGMKKETTMNPDIALQARRTLRRDLAKEVEHQIVHHTRTDCARAARTEVKGMAKATASNVRTRSG